MDPLADKIFVTTTMLILVEFQLIAAWVAAVVIAREFMVTGLRLLAVKQGKVISADKFGKLKTFLQMVMLFIGGLATYTFVWDLGDIGIALMTVFNMIVLIPMSGRAIRSLNDYTALPRDQR